MSNNYFAHDTANIEKDVEIGSGTKIWAYAHVRTGTKLGQNCILGENVFIDEGSEIGDNCKIQNHAIIYHKTILENGVFIGPNVCFTNDKQPRAINVDGSLKSADDWVSSTIKIGQGAAIGAHSCITPGVTIGQWAMAGSGSVITKDVPDYGLVYGNPAKLHGFVCACGKKLTDVVSETDSIVTLKCECGEEVKIDKETYSKII
ncbi:MAG: acyltransferase [Candidatus Berkelbacteria bacterium]